MLIAHSAQIRAVGIVAGGPFYLAAKVPDDTPTPDIIDTAPLLEQVKEYEILELIDPLIFLKNKPVFFFSGSLDTTVPSRIVKAN